MADVNSLPNIDRTVEEFFLQYASLFATKVNANGAYVDADARLRGVAQWANIVDGALLATIRKLGSVATSVRQHGAIGDGVADDRAAIQAAIQAAAAVGGAVFLPPGDYMVSESLSIPDGSRVAAASGARIITPASPTFRVIDVDGATDVVLDGIAVVSGGGTPTGSAYGFAVRGSSSDITIRDCVADGFVRGFNIAGEDEAAGLIERVTLVGCRALNSPTQFGFNVDDADVVTFRDCHAIGNGLDGFKIRRQTRNVSIVGGSASGNGVLATGDGIDAFAGGDTLLIDGIVCDGNGVAGGGGGILVKQDDIDHSDFGYVQKIQIANVRCRNNASTGLTVYTSPTPAGLPLLKYATILGGYYEGNGDYGVRIGGVGVSMHGGAAVRNGLSGILVDSLSIGVALFGVVSIANSQTTPAGLYGIEIGGASVRVVSPVVIGTDNEDASDATELDAGTVYHLDGIRVTSGASDVVITHPAIRGYTSRSVRVDMASGSCVVHAVGAGLPYSSAVAYGSAGSTWMNTTATDRGDALWVKASGAPNAPTTGWEQIVDYQHISRPADGTASVARSSGTIELNSASGAKAVTMATTGVPTGRRVRVVITTFSGGTYTLAVTRGGTSGTVTLGALLDGCDIVFDGSSWKLVQLLGAASFA